MQADVLVVGGGIVGATMAYHLSADRRVILLEAEDRPGYHATGRSAALFSETYGNALIRAVTAGSRAFLTEPPDGFAEAALASPRGELIIAAAEHLSKLDAFAPAQTSEAGRLRRLDAAEARELVPLLRPQAAAGAVYDPHVMDIDVAALHQGYLGGLLRRGGQVATDAAVAALRQRDGCWEADTRAGRFSAPALVNAAGAWADRVAVLAGLQPIGLAPLRRTAILVDPPADRDARRWPMVLDVDETFYVKPDAGLLLASPADETPAEPGDAQPEELDVALAVERLQATLDIEVQRVRKRWAGLRTFAPDRSPVLGFDEGAEGFFWAAGLGGYGVQTSAGIGRLGAALLRGEPVPADLAARGVSPSLLSPARFRGGTA